MKIVLLLACFFIFGCKNESLLLQDSITFEKEMELLTTEKELNSLIKRSSSGVVDWQLSREFAQLILEEFIFCEEFPKDSVLWDLPVIIYDINGNVRYYEFRVMSGNSVIAAIAGNAQESLGGPISKIFYMQGYSDRLTELYKSGVLSENNIPRIIDNDYPSYLIADVVVNKSGTLDINNFIDPTTGVEAENITRVMTVEELMNDCNICLENVDSTVIEQSILNYENDISALWKMAKLNKGNLCNFKVKGSKKEPRTAVSESKISKTIVNTRDRLGFDQRNYPVGYYACGATVSGFLLDFLHENGIQKIDSWSKLNYEERKSSLNSLMDIGSDGITWPDKLSAAVEHYSDYKVSLALGVVPNTSIENDLPGINLRGLDTSSKNSKKGGMHYRNVVAYREDGWWIFTWTSIKVVDGNNIENGWEEYNPFFHLFSYNLVKK